MDRNGPDAGVKIPAIKYALMVFPLPIALWGAVNVKLGIDGTKGLLFVLLAAAITTVAVLRLVDLYDGPLDDPCRALVELRRIVELHPHADLAAGARIAIARIKAQRIAESGQG